MYFKYKIIHEIPGRMRLMIPALQYLQEHNAIIDMFESIKGIETVRIEPVIKTMVIHYDSSQLDKRLVLRDIGLFFTQIEDELSLVTKKGNNIKGDVIKSIVSGILLLIAFLRKNSKVGPDMFDYLTVISTSYTVLSHGENRINHPDVLTGIISLASLGTSNILQVALVTWFVNMIEVFNELRSGNQPSFSIN